MKGIFDFLKEPLVGLTKKTITAILAFAAIALLALILGGRWIPANLLTLAYIVVILPMLIFTGLFIFQILHSSGKGREGEKTETGGANEDKEADQHKAGEKPGEGPKNGALAEGGEDAGAQTDAVRRRQARLDYLQNVIHDCSGLRLADLGEQAGDPNSVRLTLEDVYISLLTTTPKQEKKGGRKSRNQEIESAGVFTPGEENPPLSVLEAIQEAPHNRMVLLGFPGTGKSTWIRYLALRMAQELAHGKSRLEGWQGDALLPLAISLGAFADEISGDARRGSAEMLEKFIADSVKRRTEDGQACFAPHILEETREKGGLFLFDGLDEVANLNLRPRVVEAVQAFTERHSRLQAQSRFLVTCRTLSYQDARWQLAGWTQHELALLNDEQIEKFVNAWYDRHIELDRGQSNKYERKKGKLLAALRPEDRRGLLKIARFPIILTVMAMVHAHAELPDSRVEVYEKCVELLLEKWNLNRKIMGENQTLNIIDELGAHCKMRLYKGLYEIAFQAHHSREGAAGGGGQVTERLITASLAEKLGELDKVKIFLEYCQKANGLLMLRGLAENPEDADIPIRVYTFPHLTFEEYLASRHIAAVNLACRDVRLLLDGAHDRWRETVKLLGEFWCFRSPDEDKVNNLLQALGTPLGTTPSDADRRAAWLAGEVLLNQRQTCERTSLHEEQVLENLRRAACERGLAPRERADAADTLDALGWTPPDLHDFVEVCGAGERFWIAKYPVTNAQYRRFLEDPHFADEDLWKNFAEFDCPERGYARLDLRRADGLEWLAAARRDASRSPDGKLVKPRYWDDPRFGMLRPGAPVVGVTWFEAVAYCRWLQRNWGKLEEGLCGRNPFVPGEVRLPLEKEWEAAAGGLHPKGRYPWDEGEAVSGEEEVIERANIAESGIRRTTPVWMHPQGESVRGVCGLAGNTWEWQANYSDKDHDRLALRGGSWDLNADYARVAGRDHFFPNYYFNDYPGFRVLVFPR